MGAQRRRADAVSTRLARVDWEASGADLDEVGFARLPGLLTASQCRSLVRLYSDDSRFRKTIDLGRQRFGERGDYRYFGRPLPELVEQLRAQLYPPLARIANRWQQRLGGERHYPSTLRRFLAECATHGQTRPTPLLLRYDAGGYNRLHQDLYGAVAFPLQVAFLLSEPGRDFEGGEFLLIENRARMQSRGEAVALRRGEAIVFPTRERPVRGARGVQRAQLRHGVSRVASGERLTLGIIFHDAK